jgi:hypothetical protein
MDFFGPLGVSVDLEVGMTEDVYVLDGKRIGTAGESQKDWGPEIDKFVAQQRNLAQMFLASITENAASVWPGARAYYTRKNHGFTLAWPDAAVGFVCICATHARVFFDGPTLTANYLTPGDHWAELKVAIEAHEVERLAARTQETAGAARALSRRPVRVPLRTLTRVPPGTPNEVERVTLDASRRLRFERQMVYAAPTLLEFDVGRVRFEPIESNAGELLVPFFLSSDSGDLEGGISLSGERDPLRLDIYRDELGDDPFGWSTALCGYADLTTWNLIEAARHDTNMRRQGSTQRRARRGLSNATPRVRETGLPRRQAQNARVLWPGHLRPIGDTAANLAAHVAGHRRRLPAGWAPSAEARARASQLGITLDLDETWVRPHVRGGSPGYELRFKWQPHKRRLS